MAAAAQGMDPAAPVAAAPDNPDVKGLGTPGEIAIVTLLLLAAPIAMAIYKPGQAAWFVVMASMILYTLFLGRWINGRLLGVLINERNLMSLSRFQMAGWTIVILSAFVTIALERVAARSIANPLAIGMSWQLWALMGISSTSLVGSPLLLSPKANQDPAQQPVEKASEALGETVQSIASNRQGLLYSNPSVKDARFSDMFQGDEIANTAYLDVAKLQLFYFTIIGLITYGYALFAVFRDSSIAVKAAQFSMPEVAAGLVALLGISHGTYLTSKTSDKTPTAKS